MEEAGVDRLHIDVMDGHYVPQITWGAWVLEALRLWSSLPMDVHLMVEEPQVLPYIRAGAQSITFHPKTSSNPEGVLQRIKAAGCQAGLAISPLDDFMSWPSLWWSLCDCITLMSVKPGMGGQSFLPQTSSRLQTVRSKLPPIPVWVDGGITPLTAKQVAGAALLVSGSFLFSASSPKEAVMALREGAHEASKFSHGIK
jgi:ribulose-phosphate 3-epimerase